MRSKPGLYDSFCVLPVGFCDDPLVVFCFACTGFHKHPVNDAKGTPRHQGKAVLADPVWRVIRKTLSRAGYPVKIAELFLREGGLNAIPADHEAQKPAPGGGGIVAVPSCETANADRFFQTAFAVEQADQAGAEIDPGVESCWYL